MLEKARPLRGLMGCDGCCLAYLGEVRLEGSEEALYIGTVFLSAGDFLAGGGVVLYSAMGEYQYFHLTL